MLHAAHKLDDQEAKVRCLKAIDSKNVVDLLSVAALRFIERDYSDAVNIYKNIVAENKSSSSLFCYTCIV